METAKAARAPPKVSSGIVYILTLNAATEKMLSEMPAEAKAGPGSQGMRAVRSAAAALQAQARVAQDAGAGGGRNRRSTRGKRGTPRGGAVPQRDPEETDYAGDPKGVPPAVAHRDPRGQRRRQHHAQADASLVESVAEGALARTQVLMDSLPGGGYAGCFGQTQHSAAGGESGEPAGEAGNDAGRGPHGHGQADGAVQADGVNEQAGERGGSGVGEGEGGEDQAIVGIGEMKFGAQDGCKRGQRLAVEIVDRSGEDEDGKHQPAARLPGRLHWNSRVATSPTVASLGLDFGKYSTVTRRAFWGPHPKVVSPPPRIVTREGSGIRRRMIFWPSC